jgi:AmmeMemoRadiSam system protein A
MPLPKPTPLINPEQRRQLLALALASIRHGLSSGEPLTVRAEQYAPPLRQHRASFVTLNKEGQLRGCIGHLEAWQSLVEDVAQNAWAAAFRDPRFSPLTSQELERLQIHISVLTPAQPLQFTSEHDLLTQIRPQVDGLILRDGNARGTFLPSVWDALPRVEDFWQHLKQKAGLPANHWSNTLTVQRYETESFGDIVS